MIFKIKLSDEARQDLKDVFAYIAFILLEPETAKMQTRRIVQGIRKLQELPMRYPIYPHTLCRGKSIRFFPVDNYLVFYVLHEDENTVEIINILYGSRDIKNHLK